MEENELDNCVLLNENKGIVEATNANIFVVKGNEIKTPALTEGCIKGIVRKKLSKFFKRIKIIFLQKPLFLLLKCKKQMSSF